MTTVRKVKAGDLKKAMEADFKKLEQRFLSAARATAADGVGVVRERAHVAFGEVRDGIESADTATGAVIRSTAPHSAAVEVGSRPHMPPFEPILAWVRLRGLQGLDGGSQVSTAPAWVAGQIRAMGDGTATPVDAAERVAWAVCHGIAKNGTKPTWFVKNSLPDVYALLDAHMRKAAEDGL